MDLDLDEVDERLIRALQVDGRATYEALAQQVGLARSTTRARVRRLLDDGGLRVIGAVHPAVYGLAAFADLAIETEGPVRPIADEVAAFDEASFVTMTAGRVALTAELRTADLDDLARGVDRVQAIDGVRAVHVLTYLRIWKDPYFPPGTMTAVDLDDSDLALLDHLQVDGRASFAELAGVGGLSPGATRMRVLRLLDAGVLHVGALVRLDTLSHAHTYGFAISCDGDSEPVARAVAELDQVDFLATGVGWCTGIGTIRVASYDEVFESLERIRALPGVRTVESWSHLHAIKEEHDRSRAGHGTP